MAIDFNASVKISDQAQLVEVAHPIKIDRGHEWLILLTPLSLVLFLLLFMIFLPFIKTLSLLKILFTIIALVSSWIYGYYAYKIHDLTPPPNKWQTYNQYWLNGLGAFVGWLALYILIFYRIGVGSSLFNVSLWFSKADFRDLALVIVTFYGLTGYLPHMLIQNTKLGK